MRLLDALVARRLVDASSGLTLTDHGTDWLQRIGVDVSALLSADRPVVRSCLDWTERRQHLAGGAGAALCLRFVDNDWVRRAEGSRAVHVTALGERALEDLLDLTPADLDRARGMTAAHRG